MRIEWLIGLYLFVSLMMIAFNFGFLAYEKAHAKRFTQRTARIAELLGREIELNADFPTDEHKRTLERRMRQLSGMESFDLTMRHLEELDADKSERYLSNIAVVFDRLTHRFARKSDLHRAYFAYVLKRWYRQRPASDTVTQALLHYIREGSFYARQNAFEALAQVGSARAFADAVTLVERAGDFHHPKLVTETALAFAGEPEELEAEFKERFDGFKPHTQAAVINYLRMSGRGTPEKLRALMEDEAVDLEVRLACIRYFMRNFWGPAEGALQKLAATDDPARWEYAAVAATALGNYPSIKGLAVLEHCLSSPSWFVRHNAAKTLYDWGLDLDDLDDVVHGGDAYARDMLRYRWELERIGRGEPSRTMAPGQLPACARETSVAPVPGAAGSGAGS